MGSVGRLYAYHGDVLAEVRLLKLTEEVGEVADAFIDFSFRKSGHVYNVTPLKTTRKIAANTAIRPMIPKATGFDALRDATLLTPCSSCASKYLA